MEEEAPGAVYDDDDLMSLCFSDYDTRYALYVPEDIAEISSM